MSKYPSPRVETCTTIKEFLNSQLRELLPNQDLMIKNHLNLVAYLEKESPLFVLRKFRNHSNRGSLYYYDKHSFTVSDNEPALWVFMETYYESELDFLDLIENQRFPIAFAIKREERPGNIWATIGRKHQDFSANGWKHCHIFQCSPNGESIKSVNDLKRRSLRLLSPLNHFPFFSPRKFSMPFDYGENEECIGYVVWWLYTHFYTDVNKSYFKAFVEAQGFIIAIDEPKDIVIEYSIKNNLKGISKTKTMKANKKIANSNDKIKVFPIEPIINTIGVNYETSCFKIAENWYGQNRLITVNFRNGRMYQYNHDEVYDNTIYHYGNLDCWERYGYYLNSKNIPARVLPFVSEIIEINMRNHLIYFYSSTDFYHKQNQIIGLDGIVDDLKLIEYGKICYNAVSNDGSTGETGTMYPKYITIIPFSYLYKEELIIKHLEDVLTAN